jgi:predicted metal-dependent peptidase
MAEGTKPTMNDPVYRKLIAARVYMLFEMQFFGGMASRLHEVEAGEWLSTMATDGRHLFYNREFVKNLKKKELYFVLAHEVLHCVYDHICRRGHRDPDLWNMAIDYIVNYTLKKADIGRMPQLGLYNDKYTDEMSSEELYEILRKLKEKNQLTIVMPLDQHLDASAPKPKKKKGKKDDEGEGGEKGKEKGPKQKGKGGENGEDGEDGDDDGDGNGDGLPDEIDITISAKNGPPVLTEKDLEKIRSDILSDLIQTIQQTKPGKVPGNVLRVVDELINPKLDWRSMLDAHIRSSIRDDFTFQRISRKSYSIGALLPGQNFVDTIDICIAIDVSGSVGPEMIRDMLSEVKGIMEEFRDFRVRLWCFDGHVDEGSFQEFTGENIHEIDDYRMTRITGGGGTILESNWKFMREKGIEPVRFILFTDGHVGSWGEEGYCDTLFVVHDNPKAKANFGITAHYDSKEEIANRKNRYVPSQYMAMAA